MSYCLNCRSDYPEGAEDYHQAPCHACQSDGHSPCQCGERPTDRARAIPNEFSLRCGTISDGTDNVHVMTVTGWTLCKRMGEFENGSGCPDITCSECDAKLAAMLEESK